MPFGYEGIFHDEIYFLSLFFEEWTTPMQVLWEGTWDFGYLKSFAIEHMRWSSWAWEAEVEDFRIVVRIPDLVSIMRLELHFSRRLDPLAKLSLLCVNTLRQGVGSSCVKRVCHPMMLVDWLPVYGISKHTQSYRDVIIENLPNCVCLRHQPFSPSR